MRRLLLLALSWPLAAHAVTLPITVDGGVGEWIPQTQIGFDLAGDAGGSGIDFRHLSVANDENNLFIWFDTTAEVQGDEGQSIRLALDTDLNPATGQPIGSIGAELEWRLGEREGFTYFGPSTAIGHADIGLVLAPTVSANNFEIAIRLDASPGGNMLFPNSGLRILIWDEAAGDSIGAFGYTFSPGDVPPPNVPLSRQDPSHIRIASYNVLNDGLFASGSRQSAFDRLLGAVDADVFLFAEVWNNSASDVESRLESFLPSGPGETWNGLKLDSGNVIATRFPILDSWEVFPGNRLTAALLDLRPDVDSDLLVVANHWSCCTADADRQDQADALIAFLRDARTPGGDVTLAEGTPMIAGGDFNLVGLSQQLLTVLTGDIQDNGTWGPDSPPDWGGAVFTITPARHPDQRFVYTWRNDGGSFYPGQLDYLFFTSSAATLHNHFVLETRGMTAASLVAAGLQASDTETASDHAPLVGDFTVGGMVDVASSAPPRPHTLFAPEPNPFRSRSVVSFTTERSGRASLRVYTAAGHLVRELAGGVLSRGPHAVTWDGRDGSRRPVAPGVYFVRLTVEGASTTQRIVRLP